MLDILLVEEKIDDSGRLLNKVSNLSPEIRIAKIIDNKKGLIESLSNNDILIIDYKIFKKLLRNEFLRIRNYMKFYVISKPGTKLIIEAILNKINLEKE